MKVLCWGDHFKYLGTHFISDQFLKADISRSVRKFYALANAIYSHSRLRFVSEFPRLSLNFLSRILLLPLLTYNCAGLFLLNDQLRKLNVCWNNVYRKVFAMNKWQSVKCIHFFSGKLDLYNIIYKMQLKSFREAHISDSSVVSKCCRFFMSKMFSAHCAINFSIEFSNINKCIMIRLSLSVLRKFCVNV